MVKSRDRGAPPPQGHRQRSHVSRSMQYDAWLPRMAIERQSSASVLHGVPLRPGYGKHHAQDASEERVEGAAIYPEQRTASAGALGRASYSSER